MNFLLSILSSIGAGNQRFNKGKPKLPLPIRITALGLSNNCSTKLSANSAAGVGSSWEAVALAFIASFNGA